MDDGVDDGVGELVDQLDAGVLEAVGESVAGRLEQVLDHATVGGVVEGVEHLGHDELAQGACVVLPFGDLRRKGKLSCRSRSYLFELGVNPRLIWGSMVRERMYDKET